MQFSCQKNFAILTTDGYWNTGNEDWVDLRPVPTRPHGVGQQDGLAPRPMRDGASSPTP